MTLAQAFYRVSIVYKTNNMKGDQMKDYTAWLNGQSVASGTLREVDKKAKAIFLSENWQTFEGETTLRITRGARQLFVKSVILKARAV